MRVDKVISSIWSIIVLLHLVNAKAKTKPRHKYTSQQIPEAAKNLQKLAQQNHQEKINQEADQQSDQYELNDLDDNDQLEKAEMELKNNSIHQVNILDAQAKNMIGNPAMTRWQYGIVPYNIDENTFDELLKVRVKKAMDIIEAASCVRFKEIPVPKEADGEAWLHFTNPNHTRECNHEPTEGENGELIIVLGIECLKLRDVLHSVLHGLGFKDEVTHPHRDQYIRILWENVQPKYRNLFNIRRDDGFKLVEYDPMSIMHFHNRAYSVNGGLTIVPVIYGLIINPSDKLSQLDVMKLRLAFGHECNKRKVGDIVQNCKNVFYNKNTEKKENGDHDNKGDNDVDINDDRKKQNDVVESEDTKETTVDSGDHDTPVNKDDEKNKEDPNSHNYKPKKPGQDKEIPKKPEVDENKKQNEDNHWDREKEHKESENERSGEHEDDGDDKTESGEHGEENVANMKDDSDQENEEPSTEQENKEEREGEHKTDPTDEEKPAEDTEPPKVEEDQNEVDSKQYYDPMIARRFPVHLKFNKIH